MPSAAVHRSVPIPRSAGGTTRERELSLMGAFGLSAGAIPLLLPGGAQRLLAFVALQDRPTTRSTVAAALWQNLPTLQANASLRSAT